MKVQEKSEKSEKSEQAINDANLAKVLADKNSSSRAKESAFNTLYLTHQENLSNYFNIRLKDEQASEDLKMITFEKAYKYIKKYNDEFAFSTWLYSIAKNTYIDHLRKESNDGAYLFSLSEHEGSEDAVPFQVQSENLNPEQGFIRSERINMVKDAIDLIEDEFVRDLMTERFINDLSFEQIAKKLSVNNNSTLRVMIRRGKKSLKKNLTNPYA